MDNAVYIVYLVPVAMVIFALVSIPRIIRARGTHKNLLEKMTTEHPEAAKVYFAVHNGALSVTSDHITVNGIKPVPGAAAPGGAVQPQDVWLTVSDYCLVLPGTWVFSLSAMHTRPGVMYRSVSTSYGPIDVQISVAPYKSYQLTFDRKSQQFGVAEIASQQSGYSGPGIRLG